MQQRRNPPPDRRTHMSPGARRVPYSQPRHTAYPEHGRGAARTTSRLPRVSNAPRSAARPERQRKEQAEKHQRAIPWGLVAGVATLAVMLLACLLVLGVLAMMYSSDEIMGGVSVAGVDVGGQTEGEAAATLRDNWVSITLQDDDRTWAVNPAELGIMIDAEASAEAAYEQGRDEGSMIETLFGNVDVAPVVSVDMAKAQSKLEELAPQLEQAPVNAGVQLVNGQVTATPPVEGRQLDLASTLATLQEDPGNVLADGVLELSMFALQPSVTDASPMVAQAAQLLANPLNINAYDPISNESLNWGLPPEEWGRWLVATPDSSSAIGLALTLDAGGLRSYLEGQADAVGANRYLKVDDAVEGIQQAVAQQNMNPVVRVYHHETQHTVQAGETFSSIGYDYGIPYPWIQAANPGVPENLSAGQVVTIPSKDDLLPYPVVPNKRVVVSISQQRTVVYENGQVKWDWPASTGINSSPTAPGIFQIQSHETNAYAANWDLWMPHFMGVYRPVPSSDFMNGFHGFPSRGGYQLLWQNSLGSRVTYGCILLDTNNAKLLYDWAEEGVVVEIQR